MVVAPAAEAAAEASDDRKGKEEEDVVEEDGDADEERLGRGQEGAFPGRRRVKAERGEGSNLDLRCEGGEEEEEEEEEVEEATLRWAEVKGWFDGPVAAQGSKEEKEGSTLCHSVKERKEGNELLDYLRRPSGVTHLGGSCGGMLRGFGPYGKSSPLKGYSLIMSPKTLIFG